MSKEVDGDKVYEIFGWVVIVVIFILLIFVGRGCVSCVQNMSKDNQVEQTTKQKVDSVTSDDKVFKKIEPPNKDVVKKENPSTWSHLLKSKPKEMQMKQEELKNAMKKISSK